MVLLSWKQTAICNAMGGGDRKKLVQKTVLQVSTLPGSNIFVNTLDVTTFASQLRKLKT